MKKQTPQAIARLISQYPDLKEIGPFLEFFERKPVPPATRIVVKRANASNMFQRADNVDGIRRCFTRKNGDVGACNEYAFAIMHGEKDLEILTWEHRSPEFLKDIFNKHSPADVKYLIWVSMYDWYAPATDAEKDAGTMLGKHSESEIYYTILLPPKDGGFAHLLETADVLHNVELTEQMLITQTILDNQTFIQASELLDQKAKQFEKRVYLNGMKSVIDAVNGRGMSGIFNGVKVLSWVMCGRVMITMNAPTPGVLGSEDTFTLICNEDGKPQMSFRSIFATLDRANVLADLVMEGWEAIPRNQRKNHYTVDGEVKLAGM